MRDFRFLRTTWKSLLKVLPQNQKYQLPHKQKWKSFILPQQMQNQACLAEHGTPVCWALRVAQLQNPNSHLINTVGLDRPFCVALQEWVQRPLGFTLLGFSRYGREPVGPYLATISRELIILAFCWYTKKAIEACIVGKKWRDRMQKCRAK